MVEECKRALERQWPGATDSRPCPYCSAPMGEPEMGYDQDGASVAVWRCQKCGAEEHITRYPPEEPSEDGDLDESAGEERVAVCQNCGQVWPEPALRPIRDVEQRVAPGEPMPAGECPECGTLCHYGGGDVQ
jgi:DNA-directed RNA polymerase subunit RPC12/RpoP